MVNKSLVSRYACLPCKLSPRKSPLSLASAALRHAPYYTVNTGSPILADSLTWYDCRVEATHDGGDHVVFVGRVEAMGSSENPKQPLLYFANRYAQIRD